MTWIFRSTKRRPVLLNSQNRPTRFCLNVPPNVSVSGPGGAEFFANLQYNDHPQKVTPGNFTAMGTIKDKEGIVLKAGPDRKLQNAWIEVDPKAEILPLGSGQTSLTDIEGKMDANMQTKAWNKFTFNGRIHGFKGMQGYIRKTFTVNGAITASNEKIGVKNIPLSSAASVSPMISKTQGLQVTYK